MFLYAPLSLGRPNCMRIRIASLLRCDRETRCQLFWGRARNSLSLFDSAGPMKRSPFCRRTMEELIRSNVLVLQLYCVWSADVCVVSQFEGADDNDLIIISPPPPAGQDEFEWFGSNSMAEREDKIMRSAKIEEVQASSTPPHDSTRCVQERVSSCGLWSCGCDVVPGSSLCRWSQERS